MATVIRLTRHGKRNHPVYRVVVADSRRARDGKFLEQVGFYDPHPANMEIRFDNDQVLSWLSKGAQPSDTVRSLMKRSGLYAIWVAKKQGKDITGMTPTAKAPKVKPVKKAESKAKDSPEA